MHAGLARRSLGWRAWIVILAVALVGAGSVATVWHGDHAGDQDCAVCQLRHQPVAEVVGHLELGPADVAEWLEPLSRGGWIASERFSRLPARAPPV